MIRSGSTDKMLDALETPSPTPQAAPSGLPALTATVLPAHMLCSLTVLSG